MAFWRLCPGAAEGLDSEMSIPRVRQFDLRIPITSQAQIFNLVFLQFVLLLFLACVGRLERRQEIAAWEGLKNPLINFAFF